MSEGQDAPAAAPKAKKSVALSGVVAGNTALCTVGRTGNDLHYRGYDILDIAETCEFEEIAHLLVHGKLPNRAELVAYKAKLKSMRGLSSNVKAVLEWLPASSHPMDVMRSGVSALGCVLPEKDDHNAPGAKDIADRLMASLGSMLLYWYHYSTNGRRIEVETDDDSIGGHFLHLLHGREPSELWVRAMHTSLILYAEHEFNASTFTCRVVAGTGSDMYSAITAGIGALRGPKHGGANEVAFEIQKRYDSADEAEADIRRRVENKEVVIGFGHPVYTVSDPRNKIIKSVAQQLSKDAGQHEDVLHRGASRDGDVGRQEDVREPRLVQRGVVPHDGRADGDVHAAVRHVAYERLERAHHRAAPGQQDHQAERELRRTG
jgi:2-methylcitrate synthase